MIYYIQVYIHLHSVQVVIIILQYKIKNCHILLYYRLSTKAHYGLILILSVNLINYLPTLNVTVINHKSLSHKRSWRISQNLLLELVIF
jgi:hypothetical protein